MKFDTVIIGGGLSGLTAAIELASQRRRTAVVTAGQSSLHFCSGSFELLGTDGAGKAVDAPFEAMSSLPPSHPYSRLGGAAGVAPLLERVGPMLEGAGIRMTGSAKKNHWRLSPVGVFKPAWLTLDEMVSLSDLSAMPWRKVAIVNIKGYLDFFPRFLAVALEKRGVRVAMEAVTVKALADQRVSSTELRAANIARLLTDDVVDALAREVNAVAGDAEAVLFPAVAGFEDASAAERLRQAVGRPLQFVSTLGLSVPGIRMEKQLTRRLQQLGASVLHGDRVSRGFFTGDRLDAVETVNLGADRLEADNFILASGSFFSRGLTALSDGVSEPVFGLDVEAAGRRADWFEKDLFRRQPFMKFGVATDAGFRALRGGRPVENMRVAGAILSGADSVAEGSGAGVALATAMAAANAILKD